MKELVKKGKVVEFIENKADREKMFFLLNTIDKFVILNFEGNIKEDHPSLKNNDKILNEQYWLDGILFNENKQIEFVEYDNDNFEVFIKDQIESDDIIDDKRLLLGKVKEIINGYSKMYEAKIKPYWIPGEYPKGATLEISIRNEVDYDVNHIAYIKDTHFLSIQESEGGRA